MSQQELMDRVARAVAAFRNSDADYWSPEDDGSNVLDESTKPLLHAVTYGETNTIPFVTADWIIDTFHKKAADRDIERSNTFKKSLFLLSFAPQSEKDLYINWLTSQTMSTSLSYVPAALAEPFSWLQPTIFHDGQTPENAQENVEKIANWLIESKGEIQKIGLDVDAEEGFETFYSQCLSGLGQRDKVLAYNTAVKFPFMLSRPEQLEELCAESPELKRSVLSKLIPEITRYNGSLPYGGYLAKSSLFNSLLETTDFIEHIDDDQKESFFTSLICMHRDNFNVNLSAEYVCSEVANVIIKAPCKPRLSKQIVTELLLTSDSISSKSRRGYIDNCDKGVIKHYLNAPDEFKGYVQEAFKNALQVPKRKIDGFLHKAVGYMAENRPGLLIDSIHESNSLSLSNITSRFSTRAGSYGEVAGLLNMAAIQDVDRASDDLLDKVQRTASTNSKEASIESDFSPGLERMAR